MVAIIFEEYIKVTNGEKHSHNLTVTLAMINDFNEVWAKFDPYGTRFIPTKQLPALLSEVQEPIGIGLAMKDHMLTTIDALNIPCHNGRVFLPEVMWPLFHSQLNVPCRVIEK